MDLSNINLNPVPDPLIPPVPPPINPDVMQAINTASIGAAPIPPLGGEVSGMPDIGGITTPETLHADTADDGSLYERYKHVADRYPSASMLEDSVWDGDVPSCPLPTASASADTLIESQPNLGGGAFPSVNALRPGPPPRPITGIPGYGEKAKLPVEHQPGSLHSANMDREGALAVSQATQQTKGHAAVEKAFQRDLEQGQQGQKRYPHAQSVLDKELREIAKQAPKERKRTQSKSQSYAMPSEQPKDTIAEAMMRLHAHLMTHLSYKQRQNLYAIYLDQHSECPVKVRLLCENDFWPYANYLEAEESIEQYDIELMWNGIKIFV